MNNKKKNIVGNIIMICILLIAIASIVFAKYAYSKYKNLIVSENETSVAKVICEMDVVSPDVLENAVLVHPHCNISIRNYNQQDEINNVQVAFTVKVVVPEGETLPEYYWTDLSGNIIASNTDLKGFVGISKEKKDYKIVFKNTGTQTFSKNVEFKLEAVQVKAE